MGKFTKIPQDTFQGLQLDAGVLLKTFNPKNPIAPADKDIICATTGGITASCIPTYSDLGSDVDNCPTNMKELKHLDSWEAKLEFTSLGTSPAGIKLALGCADISDEDSTQVIPRRNLKQSDFSDLWWVGDRADGGFVAIHLLNALSTAGLSLKTTKSGKGQTSCTLTGHVSLDDQDKMPMEFYSADPEPEPEPEPDPAKALIQIKAESASTELLGKLVSELQEDIVITDTEIAGTLNYVEDYDGFSSIANEQEGNYLALKLDAPEDYDSATVELVGGHKGPVALDDDKNVVIRVTDKDAQSVKVTVVVNGVPYVKTYTLTGLELNSI